MQPATNYVIEVNLSALLMLLVIIHNHLVIFVSILFPGYMIIRNSIPNNFYLKLFFMGCVFSAALSPKYNVFCCFSILYINHIHVSSPLAPLRGGDRHMRSQIFLYEIQFTTTSILSFFLMGCVFSAALSLK